MQMVEELIREDGMCIMSAGLGWQKAVAVILKLHIERRRSESHLFASYTALHHVTLAMQCGAGMLHRAV